MDQINTKYDPSKVEPKWYQHWLNKKVFKSIPDDREPFTIVIPPPNVTGVLHMGHMLNATIQDILIRKARKEGKNACWVPGIDHASIATEAKVTKMLQDQGINKRDITRDEFLKYAFEWKEKFGGIILNQLQTIGASCDWDRTRFTMEPSLYKAVMQVFVNLHKKGYLYRGLRMTNWDPSAQTVLSNEEVIYKEENSQLYYIEYKIKGSDTETVTIATVRPETILGDTAIAVNPNDQRYKHLKGKKAVVPIVNREIPIILDSYVQTDFGTGCLKVTPAHDLNDYEIGQRHGLEVIDILNPDGTMAESAQYYIGMDRFETRKAIIKELRSKDFLIKQENYVNNVGRSERTNSVVEPRLTEQWFLSMKDFAKKALKAVESGDVTFFPPHFFNLYKNWLKEDNVRDWAISRQLWWGQRIPAYYYKDHVFVAESHEKAFKQAKEKLNDPNLKKEDLVQDPDVLDTWFSSWLWPISVFDGFENSKELDYYYPTNVLVTGWDIIFFWVARMVMAGYEFAPELLSKNAIDIKGIFPFKDVYFTGMVRDEKRRKMSKSIGNSPDSLKLLEKYGADGVRFGLMLSGNAGNDIIFDAPFDPISKKVKDESKICDQGKRFCNKIWNTLAFIKSRPIEKMPSSKVNILAVQWMNQKTNQAIAQLDTLFDNYKLSDALLLLYKTIWDDFSGWYIEMIKPNFGQALDKNTFEASIIILQKLMSALHPFMPFITEEIWHQLQATVKTSDLDCVIAPYPNKDSFDEKLIDKITRIQNMITQIRNARSQKGISPKESLNSFIENKIESIELLSVPGLKDLIMKMANLSSFDLRTESNSFVNVVSIVSGRDKIFLALNQKVNSESEKLKLKSELERQLKFVEGIKRKLMNEKFINGAPKPVVDKEMRKLADGEERIKMLTESLETL